VERTEGKKKEIGLELKDRSFNFGTLYENLVGMSETVGQPIRNIPVMEGEAASPQS
jgi:hypothetical protein